LLKRNSRQFKKGIFVETFSADDPIPIFPQIIQTNFQSFKTSLERGQTQPATFLKNFVNVELIYDDVKYCVLTTKTGPSLYVVELNGTYKEVFFKIIINLKLLH
jgi:hypothetical protein